ncbi:MAG: LPS-assembly lipoprotein LptE [Methylomonas sp.]
MNKLFGMKQAAKLILMVALAFLTSCGYHLRGTIALPEALKNMYLFGGSPALQSEMQMMLRGSKSKLASSPNDAAIVIKVLKEDMRNRVMSIGQTGKSSEMELTYYLRFQIYDNQEQPLLDEQTVEMNREYFNDQTAVLAKEVEENVIRKEIYKQAARMLMSRAQVAAENLKK